jgi:hypothetical protein
MLIFNKKIFFIFCFSAFSLHNMYAITSPNKQEKEDSQSEYYTVTDLYQAIANNNVELVKKIIKLYPEYVNRAVLWQKPKKIMQIINNDNKLKNP